MTKNELIVESCRNMAFQDLRDTLSAALDNRDATIAALRAELDAANIKANAWDELWSACEQWGDATAHRELEGKGRTVESLLDYAKQNKELRAEVERAKTVIENYELDYDRVVVRGEKCAMELAVEEAATLRAEVERLKKQKKYFSSECVRKGTEILRLSVANADANAELTQLREDRRVLATEATLARNLFEAAEREACEDRSMQTQQEYDRAYTAYMAVRKDTDASKALERANG